MQRCYDENPALHDVTQLTLPKSFGTLWLTLWDEEAKQLIRFRDLKRIRERMSEGPADGEPIAPTKPEAVPHSWR